MAWSDHDDTTAAAASLPKISVPGGSLVGSARSLSPVEQLLLGESTLPLATDQEERPKPVPSDDRATHLETRLRVLEERHDAIHAIEAKLRAQDERHESTKQLVLNLTEMVSELRQELRDQRHLLSARGHGGDRGSIRARLASPRKLSALDLSARPRPGSTASQGPLRRTSSIESVPKKLPPPSAQPGDLDRRRSGSVTDLPALAVAKIADMISGRKSPRSTARVAVAAGRAYATTPPLAHTLTRRFQVNALQFNDMKLSRRRRLQRWGRNFFTRAYNDAGDAAHGPMRQEAEFLPYTIHHNSLARLVWDVLIMLMIMVDIIATPLSLSFQYEPSEIRTFNTLATLLFSIDFAVQAFSSYATPKGVVVSGPKHTVPHYVGSSLALADFFAWFPFEVMFPTATAVKLLGIAKIIRLIKLRHLARRFNSSKKAGLFRMVRLFGTVFLTSHFLACYWNWVAADWREHENGYLQKSFAAKYSHCWSLVIGSLNASPPAMYSPLEETSVAFFMLIGNVLQATVFGSVAMLISSFNEQEATYNKKVFDVYERCKLLDIPTDLADRIREYYDELYRETCSVDPDADAFINELSPALISEVKFQLFREMITQIPFFSSAKIDPVVIEMLILRLRTVIYMQDDVLIRKGEFGDWMGFVGSKGSVGMVDPNTNSNLIVRVLQKGDYFGEMGLLHRAKRAHTCVALSWVQIHVLSRRDLDDVKEHYADEAEGLEDEIERFMTKRVKIPHNDDAGPSKKIMKWLM